MQNFTLLIEISADGNEVEGTVTGVKGHSCSDIQGLLDEVGDELVHRHTADWDKRAPVSIGRTTSRRQRIGG